MASTTKNPTSKNAKPLVSIFGRAKVALFSPVFANVYLGISFLVLIATSYYWAVIGAKLQLGNADQLVNPYLFGSHDVFSGAVFPGVHSFLLKWPLFLAVKYLGFSGEQYVGITVAVVMLTVSSLAAILYYIERRALFIGTIYLALASTLMLIPAQPYAGALLPVNMAMLTTRNLEYIIYIASLFFILKSQRMRNWQFCTGTGLLGLLIASDRLFFSLSVGGAVLAMAAYSIRRRWAQVTISARWFMATVVAAVISTIGLWLIEATRLTHISSQSGSGPYSLITNSHDLALGIIYGALGVLTNFGANPAFDSTILSKLPSIAEPRLIGFSGIAFIVNLLILATCLAGVWWLIKTSSGLSKNDKASTDDASKLSMMLIWSSIAAIIIFVGSKHYYAVDARYLAIVFFALFVTLATYSRKFRWNPPTLIAIGAVILVGIIAGTMSATLTNDDQKAALTDSNRRNTIIPQVLAKHPVKILVGDYWRVIPAKYQSNNELNVMPLTDCTTPRDVPSSKVWQPNLKNNSFAYVLSLDKSLTDFPNCTLEQVVAKYGRPNSSVVIAGTLDKPKELMLFYDQGIHKSTNTNGPMPSLTSTVVPIGIDDLPATNCEGPTIMNVVAHQDDDLLFMNPDLLNDVKSGHCIRSVYLTAGDSGSGSFYWLSRERGTEAAYSNMMGTKNDVWVERIVKLDGHRYVTVANLKGNPKVSLVFMHLPDGNLTGEGFDASNHESLAKLESGIIGKIHSIDQQSNYTTDQLISSIATFMTVYQPSEIRTQANFIGETFPDHSDHMAVGRFTKRAYFQYEHDHYENLVKIPLKYFIGYPIRQMAPNVSDVDLQQKQAAFLEYAKYDGGVCSTAAACDQSPTYGSYLSRQYQYTE